MALSAPIPGRFRNRRNHQLTLRPANRPELARLRPEGQTAVQLHELVTHCFHNPKHGVTYAATVDSAAVRLLIKTAHREKLIEVGEGGRLDASRFFVKIHPYERYFDQSGLTALKQFREQVQSAAPWRPPEDQDGYDGERSPHDW